VTAVAAIVRVTTGMMTVMVPRDAGRVRKLRLPPTMTTSRPERAPEGAEVDCNGFQ
jgi:hypothetical protein